MYNMSKQNYDNLPEVQRKKEEERKCEERVDNLKKKQDKLKQLDMVNFLYHIREIESNFV